MNPYSPATPLTWLRRHIIPILTIPAVIAFVVCFVVYVANHWQQLQISLR